MSPLFDSLKLNATGLERARMIAKLYEILVEQLTVVGCDFTSREFSLAKTKLEEACFYSKKSMAIQPQFQEGKPLSNAIGAELNAAGCYKGIGGLKGY